jgi:protein disulfide-isomerase-like protein
MWTRVKDFDFYRKIPKDLTETSTHGTVLSLCAALFMLILFIAEFWAFLTLNIQSNIVIDPNNQSLLRINFNITMLDMPCEFAVIDVVDVLGTRSNNVTVNVNKWQVDENGIRRGYEGRNQQQMAIQHDNTLDINVLHENGIHAIPIGEQDFERWVSIHEYTFVEFYAPWCIWCQRLHPVWESLAEKVETEALPVSIIQVDCVENRDLCFQQKIQAFPMMRLFKHGQPQPPDYRQDRTVESFLEFLKERLSHDEQLQKLTEEERKIHAERKAATKDDHPGCMMSGFLLVNR